MGKFIAEADIEVRRAVKELLQQMSEADKQEFIEDLKAELDEVGDEEPNQAQP